MASFGLGRASGGADGVYIDDPELSFAIQYIETTYGDVVSIASKKKPLLKFGRNPLVGTTRATIMDLPAGVLHETYVSSNAITTISSSSTSDTRDVVIEGHTISGSDLTFVTQTVTLTGQTQATLTTALARATRIYADDSEATDLVGTIYVYETDTSTAGVPNTASKVHCIVPAGENQSRKASTSISSQDYWIVTSFDADCYEKTASFAEVRMEQRVVGGPWRPVETIAVAAGGHGDHTFHPYHIVPKNSDVRLTSVASGASTDVGGMMHGYLAIVV